ncbi:MAG TPA: hypothetical protein VKQ30_20910 [Ktedonobacterales bacterium]|nr:hypothetical protein [Ktedonobacterales bacterium]
MEHLTDENRARINAEQQAGRARLEHHAHTSSQRMRENAEKKAAEAAADAQASQDEKDKRIAELEAKLAAVSGTAVIKDGSNMDGKSTSPQPVQVNVQSYIDGLRRAKENNPGHEQELHPAADVIKRKTTKLDAIANLDALLKK